MTAKELFYESCERLEEKGKMPDILHYSLADSNPSPIDTCEFNLKNNFGYGGNKGIYLDSQVKMLPQRERGSIQKKRVKNHNTDGGIKGVSYMAEEEVTELIGAAEET